jgi:hypothetical protein
MFQNVSKTLEKVRLELWFDGENASYNVKFIQKNDLIKGMSISIQN